jgi:hypothetical protein
MSVSKITETASGDEVLAQDKLGRLSKISTLHAIAAANAIHLPVPKYFI